MPPPGSQRSAAAGEIRSPTRVTGGTLESGDYREPPAVPRPRAAGGSPIPIAPFPPHPRRGKSRTGGRGTDDGEKLGTCGAFQGLPAWPKFMGGAPGATPGRAGHPAGPVPLKGAMEWQGTNTCPPSQCRLSFALFNLCVFVNLAAWFVLQVLWPSKLLLGRMKLSGCPAVLAVFREGALLFERLLLETIRAESSLYLNESKQKTKAVRKQLASVQDH